MKLKGVYGVRWIPVVGLFVLTLGFQNCSELTQFVPESLSAESSASLSSNHSFKISESEKVALEGSVEAVYEDYPDDTHKLKHYLKEKSGKTYEIKTEHGLVVSAMKHVKVKGRIKKNQDSSDTLEVAAEDSVVFAYNEMPTSNPFPQDYAAVGIEPYSIGEQKTLLILVNFFDSQVEEITLAEGKEWLSGLDAYVREGSKGKAWVVGDVAGWFTVNQSVSVCESYNLSNLAKSQAKLNGYDPALYNRVVYAFPKNGCGYSGSGSVGGVKTESFINGRFRQYNTLFHEFGHNLGLNHAPSWNCQDGSGPLGPDCAYMEYGDILDVMGKAIPGDVGAYSPFGKMYLGWLDAHDVVDVTSDGVYNIIPYTDNVTAKTKVLRIAKPGDPDYWLHISVHQPVGFDTIFFNNFLNFRASSYENLKNGIIVHEVTKYRSALLDMTPDSEVAYDRYDPAVTVGNSFQDPYSGIKLTTESVSSLGAAVRIEFTGQRSCRARTPSLQYPDIQYVSYNASGMPGVATEVSVTLKSPSSLDCGNESMTIGSVVPEGWSVNLGAMPVVVQAGSLTTYKITITPPATAAYQTYDLNFSVTNAQGMSSSSILRFNVKSTPPVNQAPVAVNDNVTITTKAAVKVSVLANDYDPEGKPLTITAVGRPSSGSAVINSDGTITYTPAKSFKSTDSFSYTISDGNSTRSAYVYITLSGGSGGGGKGGGGKR